MYFFRNNNDVKIEINEESNLLNEIEQIITYDDLKSCDDNTLTDMPDFIPRPTLIIPPDINNSSEGFQQQDFNIDYNREAGGAAAVRSVAADAQIVTTQELAHEFALPLTIDAESHVFLLERNYTYFLAKTIMTGMVIFIGLCIGGVIK